MGFSGRHKAKKAIAAASNAVNQLSEESKKLFEMIRPILKNIDDRQDDMIELLEESKGVMNESEKFIKK